MRSGGTGELTEAAFKSVMFELAQTWTPGSNPQKYAAFLRELLGAVTEAEGSFKEGRPKRRVFRHDGDIEAGSGQSSLFNSANTLDDLFEEAPPGGADAAPAAATGSSKGSSRKSSVFGRQEDEEWQDDAAAGATALEASPLVPASKKSREAGLKPSDASSRKPSGKGSFALAILEAASTATAASTGLKRTRSVTCSWHPPHVAPACFWNVGWNSVGRKCTPGRLRAFRASASGVAVSHGAPNSSNGRVVPRPSDRLVPSSSTMPG